MSSIQEAFEKIGYKMKEEPKQKKGNSSDPQKSSQAGQKKNSGSKALPKDYVDEAERVMRSLGKQGEDNKYKFGITTSKLRNIMSLISDIYNRENVRTAEELLEENLQRIQQMRIRVLYESGREKDVKDFVDKSNLLDYIKGIGNSRKNFIDFYHYVEALVAYHRFLGGKES